MKTYPASVIAELEKQGCAPVYAYDIDVNLPPLEAVDRLHFINHKEDVTFDSVLCSARGCKHDDTTENMTGFMGGVVLEVDNVDSENMAAIVAANNYLRGRTVTCRILFAGKFDDPTAKILLWTGKIRTATVTVKMVAFEISDIVDSSGFNVPRRFLMRTHCQNIFDNNGVTAEQILRGHPKAGCMWYTALGGADPVTGLDLVNYPEASIHHCDRTQFGKNGCAAHKRLTQFMAFPYITTGNVYIVGK